MLLFSSGCSAYYNVDITRQPQKNLKELQTLRVQMKNNLSTLDPAFAVTKEERQICKLLYSGLVTLDIKTLQVTPQIASKWEINFDGNIYTFTLNKKARFHNNAPIKASDIKFSWQRAVYDNSPEKYIFSNIVGYWDFVSGKRSDISGIKVINDSTLEVSLTVPDNSFLMSLTEPTASAIDRYQVIKKAEKFGKVGTNVYPTEQPNGSGVFKLYEWVDKQHLTLGNNYNYFLSKPQLERLEFILEEGESVVTDYNLGAIDALLDVSDLALSDEPNIKGKINSISLLQIYYLRLNPALIADIRIRQALINAVDFKKLGLTFQTDTLHQLSGITQYLSTSNPNTSANTVVYDTYNSAKLLAQGGYPGGKELQLKLYYPDGHELKNTALFLVGQWGARGIKVEAVPVNKVELNALKTTKAAGLYIDEWNASMPSLKAFFYPQFLTAFGNGISTQTDALIFDAALSADSAQMNVKFQGIEKNLRDNYLIQPLFYKSISSINKPWVSGLEGNKLGLFSFEQIRLQKH